MKMHRTIKRRMGFPFDSHKAIEKPGLFEGNAASVDLRVQVPQMLKRLVLNANPDIQHGRIED
jgi:hypothetical protein